MEVEMNHIVRLQVEIDEKDLQELERLRELGGLRTKKELWDNAFTLLKWAAKAKASGASIFSVKEDEASYKELEMPFLERLVTKTHDQTPASPSIVKIPSGKAVAAKAGSGKVSNKLNFVKKKVTA
jgi:hypothetical protein